MEENVNGNNQDTPNEAETCLIKKKDCYPAIVYNTLFCCLGNYIGDYKYLYYFPVCSPICYIKVQ